MVKATVCGVIGVLVFSIAWCGYFLGAPITPENLAAAMRYGSTFTWEFWLIAVFVFVALFMTVRNMRKK